MEDLSLHILDIVRNSIAASAGEVRILIEEDTVKDALSLEVSDNGKGMDAETRKRALDPFFTTKAARRIGLGLPLLAQAAREAGGSIEVDSAPGKWTTVKAVFRLSHPDRKPLGDIQGALGTILAANPELILVFEYRKNAEPAESTDSGRSSDADSN
jgi:signal transduction histidine kinase